MCDTIHCPIVVPEIQLYAWCLVHCLWVDLRWKKEIYRKTLCKLFISQLAFNTIAFNNCHNRSK